MKKILLLSDTHSHIDEKILKYVEQADEVWHAGDIGHHKVTDIIQGLKPLRAVFGNIDGTTIRQEFPLNNRFMCENVDVWMTHIGGYPNRYDLRIREAQDRKRIQHLLAVTQPVSHEVTFFRDRPPFKVPQQNFLFFAHETR